MTGLVLSTSSLTGDPVVNPEGEKLGKLQEIMVDIDSGTIAYAVIVFGGFLGRGEKLFAVPWGAVSVDTEEKRLVVDMDPATLADAPGFDPDHWPAFSDLEWASMVHSHYSVSPYWDERAT